MAFRRALSNKTTFLSPKFNPFFTHISHLHHGIINNENPNQDLTLSRPIIHTYLNQIRSFGGSANYNNIGAIRRTGYGCLGNGLVLNRYMSTSVGEEQETSFPNEAPMEVLSDGLPPVEGLREVAIAAADSAFPVAAVQHLIDWVHSFTGMNWWLSIVVATLLVRGATLPLVIPLHEEHSRYLLMKAKKREIQDQLRTNAIDLTATEASEKIDRLYKEYGVTEFTPEKLPYLNLPILVSFLYALSNMAEKVPSFKTGGALWFADLTTPDAMYILPCLLALLLWDTQSRIFKEKRFINNCKVVGIVSVFLIYMDFPTAYFFYWLPGRLCRLGLTVALDDPRVRKALGFPSKIG